MKSLFKPIKETEAKTQLFKVLKYLKTVLIFSLLVVSIIFIISGFENTFSNNYQGIDKLFGLLKVFITITLFISSVLIINLIESLIIINIKNK